MEESSESLNYHPDPIPAGDLLLDPYDISIGELLDSEGENEVKPRLVCDEVTGPQVDKPSDILFGFAFESSFVKLNKNINKY